ncbi:hypothetical protein CLV98_10742 [Dyadobacter jejuensis]|uniref:Uncharacterized protein n=1 Tax=Dyadobacter jejuensis TaxID=1082580 RepID=A0A316AHX0_9BACT|nr:hypothetical protein [Dyadobacter jejuensis]PWJ57335.1 hypothetical protein CLV98_10742 [Dyadobacter jejuensis]
MRARIRAYRAPEDVDSSLKYVDGHRKVLESYGVKQVSSANIEWLYDPETYVIIVESEEGDKIYGGGRIQLRNPNMRLPMEHGIAKIDAHVYDYVDQLGDYRIAEFCGLFNSKEVAGYGIGSIILGRIGVAISSQLNLKYLLALCSPPTLRNCTRIGFEIIRELGNNGAFYYPKEGLIATAIIVNDVTNIPLAKPDEQERIFDLRNNPQQITMEKGPKGEMIIQYETIILPIT